jgi:MinD-like ATPase involved in chromosome partitioning or flagellar assembly
MPKNIVTIHSFRRSVGKSSLSANLACLLALQGRRVGLIDTDFQGPSAHLFFGLSEDDIIYTFNDYMWKKCDILKTVQDLSLRLGAKDPGKLFLVPASSQISDIMQMLRVNMNLDRYTKGLDKLEKELGLDILLVDSPAGLNENTLMSIAVSNALILVMRPDQQDFQGTAVIVDVARRLKTPSIRLVLNDTSEVINHEEIASQLENTYQCGKVVILEHSEELLALGSTQPFVLEHPSHPLSSRIRDLALQL